YEDLESLADAEDRPARSHEGDEVRRELGPQPRGEDRTRPHVVSCREPARDHEEVVIVEVPTEFRGHVPGELLQVDPLGLRAEMPEERDGLVLAIRPLDEDDADPDRRALHVTTTCRGIVSPQAFRMTERARDVHCRPLARCSDVPPVVPRKVGGVPSMRWANSAYRSVRSAPPSPAAVVPTRTTGSPATLKSLVTQTRKSSTMPTPKTTGVGGHGPSDDSL